MGGVMTDRREEPQVASLLKRILEDCRNPGRLIELYYWSAEHDLADVMRQYIALSPEVRATLHAFLMLVKDEPGSVTVQIAENGEMTFSAPAAAELAKRIMNPEVPPSFLH
jgi:hypothetical protein